MIASAPEPHDPADQAGAPGCGLLSILSVALLWPVLAGFWLMVGGGAVQAETRALLIGVSAYDASIGLKPLRGPRNDIRLLRDTLRELGVRDVRVLADGLEGAGATTRASIVAAFEALAAMAGAGDTVFIHYSGHGTRQRDVSGDESDGLDEVLLPSDTRPAEPGVGLIVNAIVDDEIGHWVDAIRARGADVWLTIDACHAGTGLRDPSNLTAARFVDPADLGVRGLVRRPTGRGDKDASAGSARDRGFAGGATGQRRGDGPGAARRGGVVAFYAAQSDELAREVNFGALADPKGGAPGPWYGLFSSRLASRLKFAFEQGLTYRQLFQTVLADLNVVALPAAAKRQTPGWEGSIADRAVFRHGSRRGAGLYGVRDDVLEGGQVHGVTRGSVLSLHGDAGAGAPVGYAQVREVAHRTATLVMVEAGCRAVAAALCPPLASGAALSRARFARVVSVAKAAPISFSSVGGVAEDPAAHAAAVRALVDAIEAFNRQATRPIRLGVDAEPDVRVAFAEGRLWFGRVVAIDDQPAGLSWRPGQQVALGDLLKRIAEAEGLRGQLEAIARGASVLAPSPVSANVRVRPSDGAQLAPRDGVRDAAEECLALIDKGAYGAVRAMGEGTRLKQCDLVSVSAQGHFPGRRDVNLVHIDSQFCVTSQYMRLVDAARPETLGEGMLICSDCPGGRSSGHELAFVVVAEAVPNREPLNLSSQFPGCGDGSKTRDAATGRDGFSAIGAGAGMMPGGEPEMLWVERFSWLVVPRSVALAARRK